MRSTPDDETKDFHVQSPTVNPADLMLKISAIRKALTRADVVAKKRADESNFEFFARIALTASTLGETLFRKKDDANEAKIAAWLGIISEKATQKVLASPRTYEHISLKNLKDFSRLSLDEKSLPRLAGELYGTFGIVLIVEQGFTSMKLDGGAFCLPSGNPVVAISLRFRRYDSFWFTLMHELSHVSLHYEHLATPILDDLEDANQGALELEANRVAASTFVAPEHARRLFRQGTQLGPAELRRAAEEIGVHPAILAGQYANYTRNFAALSEIVNFLDVRSVFKDAE